MPKRNWKRNYGKRKAFSRTRGQYRAPRAYGRNPAKRNQEGDIKIGIGRARVWIFNNTDSEVVIRPGEGITLKIVREYEDRLGYVYRAVVVDSKSGEDNGDDVHFKPQDWV